MSHSLPVFRVGLEQADHQDFLPGEHRPERTDRGTDRCLDNGDSIGLDACYGRDSASSAHADSSALRRRDAKLNA